MRACSICNRVYNDSARVCENDGNRLIPVRREATTDIGPAMDWDGPMAGDIVPYRCADCMDRFDMVIDETDLDDGIDLI